MTTRRSRRNSESEEMSSIVWTNDKHAIIRQAVAYILQQALCGKKGRCPLDYFVGPLNNLIGGGEGVKVGDEMAPFDEEMIRRAFQHNNLSSIADCRDATGAAVDGIIHVRSGKQGSCRSRDAPIVHDVGLFGDMESAKIGKDNVDKDPIISKSFLRTINLDNVPDAIRNLLQEFARKEKRRVYNQQQSIKRERKRRKTLDENDGDDEEKEIDEDENTKLLRLQVFQDRKHRDEILEHLRVANEKLERSYAALRKAVESSAILGENKDHNHEINHKYPIYDNVDRASLQYYLGGVSGVLDLAGPPSNRVIVEADLRKGLLVDANTTNTTATVEPITTAGRRSTSPPRVVNFETQSIGGLLYFIPAYHELSVKNRKMQAMKNKEVVDSMTVLFSKLKSTWSTDAKRIFTAMNAFGYGSSDEGTLFTMGGTLAGLFNEVGMEINEQQIFRTLPSRPTLKNWEADVATDCLFSLCWELKEAGVTQLGITTDHGHRKGQDHLVKLLSFPNLTNTGDHTIDFLCLNVDSAGHSTEDASSAIASDVSALLEILRIFLGPEVKLSVITGDAGGGASVQNLHPALMKNGTMDEKSKRLSCDMHNLNKALETACVDTWGRQGIGHKTPFQMIWLFIRILKHVRKDLSRKYLDKVWAATVKYLRENADWKNTAIVENEIAYADFMNRLDALEGGDNDDCIIADNMYKAPANIQDPVNTRWGTTQAAVKLFCNNWHAIYFFVRTLAIGEKSKSYLNIMCCALLSLMHNKELPTDDGDNTNKKLTTNDDDNELDAFIEAVESDQTELTDDMIDEMDEMEKSIGTPLFYAVISFLDGFNDFFFAGKYAVLPQLLLSCTR